MHLILSLLLLTAAGPQVQVETLSGPTYHGTLSELNEQQLTVVTSTKRVTVVAADLQRISPELPAAVATDAASATGPWIELVDGSALVAQRYLVKGGEARLTLHGAAVSISTDRVRAVRFQAESPSQAAEWARVRALDPTADLLVLRKKDRIDYAQGVLDDVDERAVGFRLDNELIQVPRAKVEGLIYFHPPGGQLPSASATVLDLDGSRFQARQLAFGGGILKFVTPTGLEVARPLDQLRQIDFAIDKIVYLGDLRPASVQWVPFFSAGRTTELLARMFQPRKDRALVGADSAGDDGALQLRTVEDSGSVVVRSYARGLALHSRTRMTYVLSEKFRRLKATVGIDARLGNQGKVRLVVHGDGHELTAFDVAGGDAPRQLDVDVSAVHKLTVLVDYAGGSDVAGSLDLCDARLVK